MSIASAKKALNKSFTIKGVDGNNYNFGSNLVAKYEGSKGRMQGADPGRLRHLSRAILAVQKASHGVKKHKQDNPPQRSFLHDLGNSRGVLVFADIATSEVRGFIYSYRFSKLKNKHEKGEKK